jgi:hypothetical protein
MRRRLRQTARSSEGGFVIVAVLWILVALAALAAIFSVYLSNSARALGATDINVERDALVSASLELTAYRLLTADEKERPAEGAFHFRMDDAEASVTFISEAARVDLNQAPKEMLAGLFSGRTGRPRRWLADEIQAEYDQRRSGALSCRGLALLPEAGAVWPCERIKPGIGSIARAGRAAPAICDGLQQIGRY